MTNKFDAMGNNGDDREFLMELINEICSYAVGNNMSPNKTIKTIAKNMLMLIKFADFNKWGCE